MKWRLVYLGERDPYEISSYEEAFTTAMRRGLIINTIYAVRYSQPTIVTGVGTTPDKIKNEFCVENKICVVRTCARNSSSLYIDNLQIVFWVIFQPTLGRSKEEEAAPIIDGIITALDNLGLKSHLKEGGNDIMVGSKKVSSYGITLNDVCAVKLGLLINFNFDDAERSIVPKHNMRESMTTVNAELGRDLTDEQVFIALKQGFISALDDELQVEYDLTEDEENILEKLREKYTSESWIKTSRWSPVKDYGLR